MGVDRDKIYRLAEAVGAGVLMMEILRSYRDGVITEDEIGESKEADDLICGRRYIVVMDDCCVTGSFEAAYLGLYADEYSRAFDNGVVLADVMGCRFYEVDWMATNPGCADHALDALAYLRTSSASVAGRAAEDQE